MKLTWIGHSCFKLEKDGYSIIMDPYADGSVPGCKPVRETADLVLCSHEHGDHNYRDGVTLTGRAGGPFAVERIDTYHDDVMGAKRGSNQIFIISDGEDRVAHLGDLGCDLEPEQVEKLKGLDVVMIPIGGFYTIDAKQAAEIVRQLNPRIVIPMHYRSEAGGFGYDVIGTVEEFAAEMGNAVTLAGSEIETTEKQTAQVVILQPENAG